MSDRAARLRFALAAAVLVTLALAAPARAQVVQVYTKPIEPFSFQENGRAMGLSMDLWERVAREANLQFELHWVGSVGELIDALKTKQADVAIAAISITSEREAAIDFTTPYYESGLGILTSAQKQSATTIILAAISSGPFVEITLLVIALIVVIGHLLWLFERQLNPEQFPRPYLRGVWESTWWAISTMLSGGCDAKGPLAVGGRIIAALWMLVSIVGLTYFTAIITTTMTISRLNADIAGASDLPGTKVATVKGSTAERYLVEHRAKVSAFATIDQAFDALDRHAVKAVVYDEPILLYHTKRAGVRGQTVVGRLFERQNYGIGLQEGSPYRKAINGALLKLREDGVLDELNIKWFGDRD